MSSAPPDTQTIQRTVDRALACTAPPRYEDLVELEQLLRGHIEVLLPEVRALVDNRRRSSMEWHTRMGRCSRIQEHVGQGLGSGLLSARFQVETLAHDCRWLLARLAEAGKA